MLSKYNLFRVSMIHVIALDHYLSYTFKMLLISQGIQKLLNNFCNYTKTQGEGQDLPLGLTASTPPEAVRISGGCRGLYFLL